MMAQYMETKKQYHDCILFYRLGDFYEMFFDEDVPVSVAINEAVELGKRFGTDDSSSFINGILGKLAKKADA